MNPHVYLTLFWLKYEYIYKTKTSSYNSPHSILARSRFPAVESYETNSAFLLLHKSYCDQSSGPRYFLPYWMNHLKIQCSFLKYNHWERHLLFLTLAPLPLCLSFSWFCLAIYESNGHDSAKQEEAPHRAQICCGMTREVEWGAFYTEQIVLLLTQE